VFSSLEVSQSLFGFLRIYSIQYELLTKDLHFPDQSDSNLWHLFFFTFTFDRRHRSKRAAGISRLRRLPAFPDKKLKGVSKSSAFSTRRGENKKY
jgi:hypothetical protein